MNDLPPSEFQYFYQLELMQQKILSQAEIPTTEAKLAAILNLILASYYGDPLGYSLVNELADYLVPFSQQASLKVHQELESEKQ
jgi:hypothetical protein